MDFFPLSSDTRITCDGEDISEMMQKSESSDSPILQFYPTWENVAETPLVDTPEAEEMKATTERSWALLLGLSSVLLVICTVALFLLLGTLFPSESSGESLDGGRFSRSALSKFVDLTPLSTRSFVRGVDGVELDLMQMNEEMNALTRRAEEMSQMMMKHGDSLQELQANSNQALCSPDNDWAPGSTIDEAHTTPSAGRKPGQWLPWIHSSLWAPHGHEVTIAVGPVTRGHCFAFSVPGQIQLLLPHTVGVAGWGVTALMSESQPQRIRAVALPSGEDLGTLNFDRKNPARMQKVVLDKSIHTKTVRFLIDSSFGASYCCLYRLHVFG